MAPVKTYENFYRLELLGGISSAGETEKKHGQKHGSVERRS